MIDPAALQRFFKRRTLGSPDAAIAFVLWRLLRRFEREFNRALAPIDLTYLQFTVLALVAWNNRSGEPTAQAEIARASGVDPMQLSQTLGLLESKRMIVRRRVTGNAAIKSAEITATGFAALEAAMPLGVEIQARMFGAAGKPGGALHASLIGLLDDGTDDGRG